MKKCAENLGDKSITESEESSEEEEFDLLQIDEIINKKQNLDVED